MYVLFRQRDMATSDQASSQLEIIDTAGVEQFTGINESYIQVRGVLL